MKFMPALLAIVSVAPAVDLKVAPRPEKYTRHDYLKDRVHVQPLFDTPLRHAFVTRGPDGSYYMTGTSGPDFQNNDGVWLWKSADRKTWHPVGQVWSIEKQGTAWQRERRLNPDNPAGPLVRGMTAPEIHFLKGSWWIPYSMNGHGTGLLKSTTGQAEGPYADAGWITAREGDASLFEDFDGAVYWVWGPGRIAPLNNDLTALAGPAAQLFQTGDEYATRQVHAQHHHPSGGSLFKERVKGKPPRYYWVYDAGACRLGSYCQDTYLASSDKLAGPYGGRELLIAHGGQSAMFQDENGSWFGTFYGADQHAVFRDRPGIVELPYDRIRGQPARQLHVYTEAGPWAAMQPLFADAQVNDEQILNAPDGHYYFTGSVWDPFRYGGLTFWKSSTLAPRAAAPENWRELRGPSYADIPLIRELAERDPGLLDFTVPRGKARLNPVMWNPEIHYLKGTFWALGQTGFTDPGVRQALEAAGMKGCPLWKSASGTADGPWEVHAWIPYSSPSLFADDDGSVYVLDGVSAIAMLRDDLSGIDLETTERIGKERDIRAFGSYNTLKTREDLKMDYDIGICMVKMFGKYVVFTCNTIGGYDYQYYVADDIWGPYSRPRVAMPHGGHSFVMKDKEGKWRSLQWARTTAMAPMLHELHVEQTGGDIIIMPQWEYHRRKAKGNEQ